MALAIYRKYRPRIFEDLLGQELISQILKNAASQNKFSHAYLFSGPRGSGKTTAARLISKQLIAGLVKRMPRLPSLANPVIIARLARR